MLLVTTILTKRSTFLPETLASYFLGKGIDKLLPLDVFAGRKRGLAGKPGPGNASLCSAVQKHFSFFKIYLPLNYG